MTKQEFLDSLRACLSGLPAEETEERLSFYDEMLDDRIEEGLTEEEAVAGLGPVKDVAEQILSEIPLSRLVREKVRPKRGLRAWEIVLLVLGSPIWLSLLIAALAVILSVYVVLWSVVVCLYAADLALAAGALAGIAGCVLYLSQGRLPAAAAGLGAGAVCAGLAVLLFIGCNRTAAGMVIVTKKFGIWIRSLFIRKGDAE
ncbi:MAG: DUF1700 domain-containing protein [Oscillospiraceae bacterium]|nr:DUF1700 domain-containing protein [Oscillospiraceae bacterium]